MDTKEYIYLLLSFLTAYFLMYFLRRWSNRRRMLRPFLTQHAINETSAKSFQELFEANQENTKENRMHLIPYLTYFQQQIIHVTSDNRLYLNKTNYFGMIKREVLRVLLIGCILGVSFFITWWV